TGVICGAGYTAMGFVKRMEEAGVKIPRDIEVVSFDDIPLMRVLTPKLPRVDQNLNLLAEKTLELLESINDQGQAAEHTVSIVPTPLKANRVQADGGQDSSSKGSSVHPHSVGRPEYARSLIHGSFELTHNILRSDLDQIMSIAPLFEQYMEVGCLTKPVKD